MKRLLPFILGILLIGLIACLPLLLRMERFRTQVAGHLSQQLNRRVVIGQMTGGFFPPSLKLQNVGLLNPGDSPLLQVEQITAFLDWKALFKAQLVPQSITFRGWVAYVRRNSNASWAWDEWLTPTAQLGEKSGWPLKKIVLDQGECQAIDPFGQSPEKFVIQVIHGEWQHDRQYVSINGVLTSLPAPVNFLFQGSGRFISNPQWSAVLDLTDEGRQWKLDLKVDGDQVETASGHSEQWRLDTAYALVRYYTRLPVPPPAGSPGVFLQDWKSRLEWHGDTLNFTQSAAIEGGHAEASGTLLFKPTLSTARIDLALQDVKSQLLEAAIWGTAPLEGVATGLAHFDVMLSSNPWGSVKGQGALELKNGRYYWPDASSRGLAKARIMKYLTKKYTGFPSNGLPYAKMSAHWQVRDGVFSFDDTFCSLGDVKIALAGRYDAAHRGIDAYTRVQVQERNADLLKELPPSYLSKSQGTVRIQPMNGRVQGTPNEWYLRTIRGSKIPAAILAKLSRTLRMK